MLTNMKYKLNHREQQKMNLLKSLIEIASMSDEECRRIDQQNRK